MNLKKHWNGQYGKSAFIKNGTLGLIEADMLKLRAGEQKHYYEKDGKEYGLVILGGKCSVVGEGFAFENIGKRKNVFDGPAASVYLPKDCELITTDTLGMAFEPEQRFEAPDGSDLIFDTGIDGKKREGTICAGPAAGSECRFCIPKAE